MTTVAFLRNSGNLATSSAMKWALYDQSPRIHPGLGILADRGLDVGLGPGVVGSILEDLQGIFVGETRKASPAPAKKPSRRSRAFAAAAVPTKATVLPP